MGSLSLLKQVEADGNFSNEPIIGVAINLFLDTSNEPIITSSAFWLGLDG